MRKPKNYWNNKNNCAEVAKKCQTRLEFKNRFRTAYKHCYENSWMNDVCSHMVEVVKPKNYWTKEQCIEEARKYNYIKDFRKNSESAYIISLRNNWMGEACSHMMKLNNLYMKVGYKIIFKSLLNNEVYIYVGFTCDFNRRLNQHLNSSYDNLFNPIKKYNLVLIDSFIYHESLPAEQAKLLEIENIDFHKKEGKYIVLNQSKGGEGLMGKYELYNKDFCKSILSDCESVSDAISKNRKVYEKARCKGWMNEIAPHIKMRKFPSGFFTKKINCLELSKTCKTLSQFREIYPRAYKVSYQNNWLDEFFENKTFKKPRNFWTNKIECKSAAATCTNRESFHKNFPGAYYSSNKNKWLDEFFPKQKANE